ncbi:hypothetical protein HDC90_004312 [Pedobacter sp. AK013]|uniref:hypothetical protein n=1 Tax=Pedobacter sp. AK013 TaxID=2723071 RepID=UPI00161558BC|nr:hypothetical protein [Pedobacter sp. AK013]MBB6239654.1 hypothetical protein [Pedobacter sp. AK013]
MTKEQLRKESMRLMLAQELTDTKESLDIYLKLLFKIINQHIDPVVNGSLEEARLTLQMVFSKTLNLRGLLDGLNYNGENGKRLLNFIDPTIIASGARNITELVSTFHLVYSLPNDKDNQLVAYNLWVIAGLKFRQRFGEAISSEENKKKLVDESISIDNLIKGIYETTLFINLPEDKQNKIKKAIKDKDYRVKLSNTEVLNLHWQAIIDEMGFRQELTGTLYTYFSLYAHPSNVSVFQYGDLFHNGKDAHIRMSMYNIKTLSAVLSKFILDYIKLFPDVINIFNEMTILEQVVVNGNLRFATMDRQIINNAGDALN